MKRYRHVLYRACLALRPIHIVCGANKPNMKQHLCFSRANRLKYVCVEKSSSRGVVIAPPTLCEDIMKYLPVFFMAVVVMVAVADVLADVCYTHLDGNNFK